MAKWQYTKGLHELGNGVYAYLQPDGGLGLSNAGLLVDGDRSVLVDTLMDLPLTREMLSAMSRATPAAKTIDVLVNTHANLDHTFGNQLVQGAEIIASAACAEEMRQENQAFLERFQSWQREGWRASPMHGAMARFNFDGIVITLPTRTFSERRLSLPLGDKVIEVIHVGPAHTKGDVIIYSPRDRVVYTGDVLFIGTHPVIWVGPWNHWIEACELILSLDVDVVVPGHGPITDKRGAKEMLDWIVYLRDEAKKRYDAGLSLEETVMDIKVYAPISAWIDADRIVPNVNLLFREFGGRGAVTSQEELIQLQMQLAQAHRPAEDDHVHH